MLKIDKRKQLRHFTKKLLVRYLRIAKHYEQQHGLYETGRQAGPIESETRCCHDARS